MSGAVKEFLRFVNASVSPYHAVHQARTALEAAGYELISEAAPWKLKAGGKYYFTRSQSSIVAFAIGGQFNPGNGFNVVACHTDSPVLKVKPISIHQRAGYLQVGVEPYGGGLWHTWFDRDLAVAGRVLVRNGSQYVSRLVHIDRPILRIPNLAIHLNRAVNTDGFQFNLQTHVLPVLATAVKSELENPAGAKHQALLLKLLADELKCDPADVADFDLVLCDTQPAQLTGAAEEFVASPRLDNLCMSFCGLKGLVEASGLDSESAVRVLALFDHEEVGSQSDHGAGSPIMLELVKRVTSVFAGSDTPPDVMEVALRKSFLVSADMAHALHPNYAEKHEEHHQPMMHRGVVLKINSNQRYATSALTALPLRLVATRAGVTLQEFVVRNDSACGSTIGPIIAALCGMRTVDIGVPQLAMHSIREMCGASDIDAAVQLCTAFYSEFTAIDATVQTEL